MKNNDRAIVETNFSNNDEFFFLDGTIFILDRLVMCKCGLNRFSTITEFNHGSYFHRSMLVNFVNEFLQKSLPRFCSILPGTR